MQTLRYLLWLHAWELVSDVKHREGDFINNWNEKKDCFYEVWPWDSGGNAEKEWKVAVKREHRLAKQTRRKTKQV
jgi:hypothetical protein